jgi:ligand-binding sensor domain-containing protein/signal transduction histidine kinase
LIVFLWGALVPLSRAEASKPGAEDAQFITDTWKVEDGLPHNSITSILQTRDGYLWLGTPNGLARFDGVRFSAVRGGDVSALKSNRILCLYEDRQGALWIGTRDGGLACYQRGQFACFTFRDGLSSDTVLCISEDNAGDLWVGTASGLNRRTDGRFVNFFKTDGLSDDRVNAILQARVGPLLIATGKGLCRFSAGRLKKCDVPDLPWAQGGIGFVCEPSEGQIWIAGDRGLCQLGAAGADGGMAAARVLPANVLALTKRKTGEIWFGTADGDLCRLEAGSTTGVQTRVGHFPSAIAALCEDREGNLWIGTANDGLYRLKQRQFHWIPFPEDLDPSQPPSVFETRDGQVWLASADKGLYQSHNGRFELAERWPLPKGVVVQTVQGIRPGEFWIGTQGEGLFHYQDGSLSHFSQGDGLSDSTIESLWADKDGSLWIGTRNGGLNRLRDSVITRFNTLWGFSGNFASALVRDAHGTFWIGTTGDGLFEFAQDRVRGFTNNAALPSRHILTLHADEAGCLWVGTAAGLCRVNGGQITTFTASNGLTDDPVNQLQSDDQGNLWVGCNHTLFRLGKAQLEACARGQIRRIDAVAYGKADGLPNFQCLSGAQPRYGRERGATVWFATTRGLAVVEPSRLQWNTQPPPVAIEQMLVDGQSVPLAEPIRVPPGKQSLQFQYTALSLTAPEKVRFRYRLEGVDRNWNDVCDTRSARYHKVPPGTCRFHVLACNNDGVWNEAGAALTVVLVPFWWATVWFRLTAALALAALLGGLYRLRRARRREIELLRVKIAGDLHDEVGSSLWSITLLSQMLEKHEALPAECRQTAGNVHRIAVQTSNSIRDIVWLINPAFDTVEDLVMRMKDFSGIALRGVECRWRCDGTNLFEKLSLDLRKNLLLLFKEAVTNVSKHARATRVEIHLEERAGLWRLIVRDNGVGFDPARPTTGNGLESLRARARKIGARLEIQSQPGQGTTLVFTTPSRIPKRKFKP